VKSTFNGTTTTYFVGNHYEVTGSTITKYYYAGSQRIAMRTNGTLNYLLGDHLGSTSLTTNASGQVVSELRYKAWGETRFASGTTPTKYQYTGQFSYTSDFGLYFYNARWYDPVLGRFNQPDSIIPQIQGVQAWDRYAYSNNNPLRYNDPTGHSTCSTISNQYAKGHCENWSPENEDYDPCAFNTWDCSGPIDWSNGDRLISRPIMGLHLGGSLNLGIAVEDYVYAQGDVLFDPSSGAFYGMITTGSGGYLGTPSAFGGQLYAGTSNVYGVPGNMNPGQVEQLLEGPNLDIALEAGVDVGIEVGGSSGVSLDINPVTGGFQETSAGQMYTTERSGGVGFGLIPTALDIGGQGGKSYSNAWLLGQIPWWSAFLP
jgi:RHS repeat-associated protein